MQQSEKKKKKTFSFLLSPIYYAFRVDGLAPSRSNLDLGKASPTGVGIEWVIDNQATRERERERDAKIARLTICQGRRTADIVGTSIGWQGISRDEEAGRSFCGGFHGFHVYGETTP